MFERAKFRKFQLREHGFTYKERHYDFNDIAHIFFERVRTTQKINFAKVGEAHSASLQLTLYTGDIIKLSFDESAFLLGLNFDRRKDIEQLLNLYVFLSEKTFEKRAQQYMWEIENRGYFMYGGCRFDPSKKEIAFKNKNFPIEKSSFLKSYGRIELRKNDFRFLAKILRAISWEIPHFNTSTDTDVIFFLLDRYFGLRWQE